jgi:hypothetical protein
MKRLFRFSAIIVVYLLSSAKSCDNQEQFDAMRDQRKVKSAMDSIRSEFSAATPSASTLNAFEETAKLRFADFADYLNILADTGVAPAFREHTKQMIRDLFLPGNVVLEFSLDGSKKQEAFTLDALLTEGPPTGIKAHVSCPVKVWVMDDLQAQNDSLFAGRLGFSANTDATSPDPEKYQLSGGSIRFYALKREKLFGKDSLKVWTVLLGGNE